MRIRRPLCLVSVIFVGVLFIILQLCGGVDEKEYAKDSRHVTVRGVICDKLVKNNTDQLHVRGECLEDEKSGKYILYLESQYVDEFRIGQYIEAEGTYQNFSIPENDGQFNTRRYYRIRGYVASIKKTRIRQKGIKCNEYKELLYRRKEKTKAIFFDNMSEKEAGTLSAMVLGDKTDLDTDVKEAYQDAGISHVLSLSGLHIATVGMTIFFILCRLGIGIKVSSILSTACMVSYGIMTGMSTSTKRALIMFLLGVLARNIGRTYDLLSAASLSALLILLENPYFIYDSGFLMSFLSIEGIGLLYPIFNEMTEIIVNNRLMKILDSIRQGMCISISASLATLPVVMNNFYKLSRYSVLVNIIVVPLMAVILWVGIIAGGLGGMIGGMAVSPLLYVDENILRLYTVVSEIVGQVQGNMWVTGKAGITQTIFYIILMFIFIGLHNVNVTKKYIANSVKIAIILFSVLILSFRAKPDMSVNVLSVGQGACNVIYGKSIPTVLIDGGSTDVKNVGKYRIIPFLLSKGINKIDYVFVSHPDADHINGINELLKEKGRNIKVSHVFMSVNSKELQELSKECGAEIHVMRDGDHIDKGDLNIKCISPQHKSENEQKVKNTNVESLNDESLVLTVNYKNEFVSLFPGDISSDIEKEICARHNLNYVNLLAAPHHGSKYSSSEIFIKNVSPDICTISSGLGNSYGHPHKEMLERVFNYVPENRVFRTDQNGQITVTVDDRKTRIMLHYKQ